MTRKELYKMVKEKNYKLTKEEVEALGWAEYHWRNNHLVNGFANYTEEQYARAQRKIIVDILAARSWIIIQNDEYLLRNSLLA